jgi:hypothetical protein
MPVVYINRIQNCLITRLGLRLIAIVKVGLKPALAHDLANNPDHLPMATSYGPETQSYGSKDMAQWNSGYKELMLQPA